MGFVTTANEIKAPTTVSDATAIKMDEVAEAPLASAKLDDPLKQGPKRQGHKGTMGATKARGAKHKAASQSEDSKEVLSKRSKTDRDTGIATA